MRKIFNIIKENILEIILLVLISLFSISIIDKSVTNDTFTAILNGNYIINTGSVDEKEVFTFNDSLKFIKLRWAFDVIVAKIYNILSFNGLYLFIISISILNAIILYESLNKLNKSKILAFLITLITIYYMQVNFVCRAQIISYLIFNIELFLLNSLLNTNKTRYVVFLIILSILLVNFHASVWLVFFIPFIPIFLEKIAWFLFKTKTFFNVENHNIKKICITFIVCIFTGLISPLKLYPYTYIFQVMSGVSKEFISELQPLDLLYVFPFNFIILFLIFVMIFTKLKINIKDFFMILGSLLMAKLAIRNSFISIIFLAYSLTKIIKSIFDIYNINFILDGIEKKITNNILPKIFVIILVMYFVIGNLKFSLTQQTIPNDFYPVEATEYILNNTDFKKDRYYADFNYASYLEFYGIRPLLDSRSEIFCKEFSNVEILEDYYKIISEDYNYIENVISKYNITKILVNNRNELVDVLANKENYIKIYEDEYFILYDIK